MADGTIFPAFIQLRHHPDNSAASSFIAQVDSTLNTAERRFEEFSGEAKRMIDRVLKVDLNAFGSLDLGVADLQRQASVLQQQALAARELATATELAAHEAGDFSQTARLQIAAMQAAAREAEQGAAAAREYASAQAQVQEQLNRSVSAVTTVTGATRGHMIANDNAAASAAAARMGMQQLGYQLNDVATMWAMGARPMQIFASQSGQVVQAVQMMAGGTSRLATFLGGPWGIALTTAAIAVTPLIAKLFEAEDKFADVGDAAEEAMRRVHASLQTASEFSNAASENVEKRLNAMGQLAQAEAQIASTMERIEALSGTPGGAQAMEVQVARLGRFEAQKAEAETAIRDAEAALQELRDLANVREMQTANQAIYNARPERNGNAAISEEAKAWERANDEAQRYIETLQQEIATIGKSPGELRQLEIARAKDAAATDDQRRQIETLNAAREEALTLQARNEAALRDAQASEEFYGTTIRALQDELALLGLVGSARANAALALEEESFKADLLSQGIIDVNGAWEEYLQLRTQIIEGESALERERQNAALLADELNRVVGALGNAGGVAGGLGALLGVLGGSASAITGPLGILLGTRVGPGVDEQGEVIARTIGDELRDVFGANGEFGQAMTDVLKGAGLGSLAASSIFGTDSATGQLGGAIGGALGQEAGKALTSGLTGFLGSAGGPLGSIAGGLLGGLVGGLFGSKPQGSALLTGQGAISSTGSARDAALSLGGSVQSALAQIAEQLDAEIGSYRVSIGSYRDNYRVSTSGGSKMGGYSGSEAENERRYGLYNFGSDQGAAIAFAVMDALKDGAIRGIRSGTARLLQSGSDVERALQDALAYEDVFRRIEAREDPLGFAVGELDKEFEHLKDLFERAGASTQEWVSLENLYWTERDEILREAMDRELGTLRGFLSELTVGNSALSLRDRRTAAVAEFNPLAQRVEAGDATAYDDFVAAARTLLEIEQQISGSQGNYFDLLEQVQGITREALGARTGEFDIGNRESPFGNAPIAVDNSGVVSAIEDMTSSLVDQLGAKLDAANENLGRVINRLSQAPSYQYGSRGSW